MRRALAPLGLLVLLALPAASACSFAAPGPPLPARIWVWDLDARREVDAVDLWSRGLDADCGLLLAHDLDGDRLAWADRAGDSMGVWLREVGQAGPPRLVFRLDGMYQDLDLHGDLLSIYVETRKQGVDALPMGHLFTVNLATGEAERADLAPDWLGDPVVADGVATWDAVRRDDYGHRLHAYDLVAGAWLDQGVNYADLGAPGRGTLLTANRDWVLFAADGATRAYHRPTRQVHLLDDGVVGRPLLDGDRLYVQPAHTELAAMTLPDGPLANLSLPPRPMFRGNAIDGNRVVLGQYAVPEGEPRPPSPPAWVERPPMGQDFPLPEAWRHDDAPGLLAVPWPSALLAALAGAAVLRRRGKGR